MPILLLCPKSPPLSILTISPIMTSPPHPLPPPSQAPPRNLQQSHINPPTNTNDNNPSNLQLVPPPSNPPEPYPIGFNQWRFHKYLNEHMGNRQYNVISQTRNQSQLPQPPPPSISQLSAFLQAPGGGAWQQQKGSNQGSRTPHVPNLQVPAGSSQHSTDFQAPEVAYTQQQPNFCSQPPLFPQQHFAPTNPAYYPLPTTLNVSTSRPPPPITLLRNPQIHSYQPGHTHPRNIPFTHPRQPTNLSLHPTNIARSNKNFTYSGPSKSFSKDTRGGFE